MSLGAIEFAGHVYSRLRARLYTLLLATQFKHMGPGSRVMPPFRGANLHQINFDEGVIIERDCWITAPGDPKADTVKLTIGAHTGIGMGATIAAAQQVVIGEYVVTARNVYISDHGHAFKDVTVPISRQGIDNIKPVFIGRHCWLGQNAVVLPGVTVGQHCVIGANSVVNRNIPDFSVAAGVPARVVRTYNKSTGQWERVP